MDKDLLRIVIIIMGVMLMLGMVLWSSFKYKGTRRGIDFYDKGNPLDKIDKTLIINSDNDNFDIVPIGSALDNDFSDGPVITTHETMPEQGNDLPPLIQFSIVAVDDAGFNGKVLLDTFQQVGLEYGSMKVFERLDDQRRVDFAVASMIEPGTFPENDLESFNCPGIVFFLQSDEFENPLPVFDNFIQVINLLATELNGNIWDHNRQPLTDETIQKFRMHLEP